MAGTILLRQHGVVNPAQQHEGVHNHHDHPAAVVPEERNNVDRTQMINIRALSEIVERKYAILNARQNALKERIEQQLPEYEYPTVEQRNLVSFLESNLR
jgi:hypothetical protein